MPRSARRPPSPRPICANCRPVPPWTRPPRSRRLKPRHGRGLVRLQDPRAPTAPVSMADIIPLCSWLTRSAHKRQFACSRSSPTAAAGRQGTRGAGGGGGGRGKWQNLWGRRCRSSEDLASLYVGRWTKGFFLSLQPLSVTRRWYFLVNMWNSAFCTCFSINSADFASQS
jgi:hypothetical protein